MKHSGPLEHHDVQLVLETLLGDVLQGPVPVVVVIRAKVIGTADYLVPRGLVKHHSHVVLATDPRCNLHLGLKDGWQEGLEEEVSFALYTH